MKGGWSPLKSFQQDASKFSMEFTQDARNRTVIPINLSSLNEYSHKIEWHFKAHLDAHKPESTLRPE
jgi:hypothetical protein